MSLPRTLLVAVVAAVAIAIPANAFALDHVTITTTPISIPAAAKKKKKLPLCKKHQKSTKKHPCRKRKRKVAGADVRQNPPVPGWTLQLFMDQNTDGSWTTDAILQRKVGNATELHEYSQKLTPLWGPIPDDLSSAEFDNPWFDGWGSPTKFTATGPLSTGTPPAGCAGGTFQMRTGTLSGFTFTPPDDNYFHAIKIPSFQATLSANTGTAPTCGNPPPTCFHGTTLFVGDTRAYQNGFFFASLANGAATEEYITERVVSPFAIFDILSVSGLPASDVAFASNFGTGVISTAGAAPWLTGSFNFTLSGTPLAFANPACGGAQSTFGQGTSTGAIVPHFAATAPSSPWGSGFAGGPSILTASP